MPGLLGVVGGANAGSVAPYFEAVRAAMDHGGRLVHEATVDHAGRWALGRVHLGVLQPATQVSGDDRITALFHGDLDNAAALETAVGPHEGAQPGGTGPLLRALYRQGTGFARSLNGAFSAAILDAEACRLLLISDRLGSYPLYWFKTPERFVFASELRAALRAHPRPVLNPRAVTDLLNFGFPLGNKTLAADVDLLPPASVLIYDWRQDSVHIESYGSIAEAFRPGDLSHAEYLEALTRALAGAMERATAGTHSYGLSLSGGLDTRVLLSALDQLKRPVSTFTLGGRGCADEVVSYQLARMAGSVHRFTALDDQYLDDLLPTLRRMVSLTDGMYLTHGCTEMLALRAFEESDCSVLLRGHCGELAKTSTAWPLHTDPRIHAMTSVGEFVPYLLARWTPVNRGRSTDLLADSWIEALDGYDARRPLEDAVAGGALSPAELCSYLYVKEYHRRVTVPSLEIFRSALEVRLPLADVAFVECVLQGSARWRDGTTIHKALIAANNPAYLRVRNPNTGAPAGAGPVQEAVFDKLNTILRRLNVYGYRHYHSFDGWMRRALLDVFNRVLLDPDTLARGVFRESAIRRRVQQASQGMRDDDDLLQALVIVELWQRENL